MAGYGTDEAFTAWLSANGYSLPVGAPTAAVLRQRGSAYIDATYGERFTGVPTDLLSQDRAWPRTGATAYGTALASDLIPQRVIEASYMAAYLEATSPGSLTGSVVSGAAIKRERVEGAVEVEYAVSENTDAVQAARAIVPAIEGLLAPLLCPVSAGIGIAVV